MFALDSGAGGATNQIFRDVAVTSTNQVVAVGLTMVTHGRCLHSRGTIFGAFTWPSAGMDLFMAVATDDFGGYYVTGTGTVAPGNVKVFSGRGSVFAGGGGWISLWGPPVVSGANVPYAIAVRGTTCVVVGIVNTSGPTGIDQIVLGYVY